MKPKRNELKTLRKKFTVKEVSKYFEVSISTIERWSKDYKLHHHECKYGKPLVNFLSQKQMEVIEGSLLGDGCITGLSRDGLLSRNGYYTLKQKLDNREYVEGMQGILKPFSSKVVSGKHRCPTIDHNGNITHDKSKWNGKWCYYCKLNTASHRLFTELALKWYPEGKKIVPSDIQLTWMMIAIWMCEDGTHRPSKKEIVLCTNGFTKNTVEFLISKLFDIGVKAYLVKHYDDWKIGIKVSSYDLFIDGIEPFILWECMKYKVRKMK